MANMFGALNRFISRLDANDSQGAQKPSSAGAFGFQVLRNTNTEISLEPWFDFIIGINGRTIDNADPTLFSTEIRNCAGATISLGYTARRARSFARFTRVCRTMRDWDCSCSGAR